MRRWELALVAVAAVGSAAVVAARLRKIAFREPWSPERSEAFWREHLADVAEAR